VKPKRESGNTPEVDDPWWRWGHKCVDAEEIPQGQPQFRMGKVPENDPTPRRGRNPFP